MSGVTAIRNGRVAVQVKLWLDEDDPAKREYRARSKPATSTVHEHSAQCTSTVHEHSTSEISAIRSSGTSSDNADLVPGRLAR